MSDLDEPTPSTGTETPDSQLSKKNEFTTPPPIQQKLLLTPKSAVIKRVTALKGEACSSPAFRVPVSPLMKRLGYGTGVGVYLLERSPKSTGEIRSPWAIKKICKIKEAKKLYTDRLEYEASILKQLSHPNIVGYRGFAKPINDGAFLAMEKASTSLGDLIEDRMTSLLDSGDLSPSPFPAASIAKVALNISKALDYLHREKKMVHGDLKSANVLIFGDFELIKLCDFGVARKLKEDGTLDGSYVGTEIWNPMEVIQQIGIPKYPITNKVDIYPFGLTIFEMISLKPPHLPTDEEDETCSDSDTSFNESIFEEILAERVGTRPLLPDLEFDDSYNKVLEIFYCCTEEDPSNRPNAEDIIVLLCLKDSATI